MRWWPAKKKISIVSDFYTSCMIRSSNNLLLIIWYHLLMLVKIIVGAFYRGFYMIPYALHWVRNGNRINTILLSDYGMMINATYWWFTRIVLYSTIFPFNILILHYLRDVFYPGLIDFKWAAVHFTFFDFECSLISYLCCCRSCMICSSLIFMGTKR